MIRAVLLFFVLAAATLGAELKVGSLNCYLLFDPAEDHRGKVDDENEVTPAQYRQKLSNLATLIRGYDLVALQETGGRSEISALAKSSGTSWLWTQGNDTATGQEVGILYRMPGWTVTSKGRVAALDKVVSKHLLVLANKGTDRIYFLAIHLLRPIGAQQEKHDKQRTAIDAWMKDLLAREANATIIVLGDTNNSEAHPLYGLGTEAGALNKFAATHLTNKCYDRLVALGKGSWSSVEIRRPPYGEKPNTLNKRLWTDHFFIGATLKTP